MCVNKSTVPFFLSPPSTFARSHNHHTVDVRERSPTIARASCILTTSIENDRNKFSKSYFFTAITSVYTSCPPGISTPLEKYRG
jgi:hypothetical protein